MILLFTPLAFNRLRLLPFPLPNNFLFGEFCFLFEIQLRKILRLFSVVIFCSVMRQISREVKRMKGSKKSGKTYENHEERKISRQVSLNVPNSFTCLRQWKAKTWKFNKQINLQFSGRMKMEEHAPQGNFLGFIAQICFLIFLLPLFVVVVFFLKKFSHSVKAISTTKV